MFKQRPGMIGAFTGAAVTSILFTFFPDSIGGMIEDLADYVPVESLALRWPLVILAGGGWLGYLVGMSGAILFRANCNWVLSGIFVIITLAGGLLSYLCEFTLAQGAVFTVAMLLFSVWVFSVGGSSFGALTENRGIGFVVTAGFIAALLFSFSDVAHSGSATPDRPVSFLLVVVLFLPYALRSMVELVWS